jgi:CheY-like chemotaxis protein
VCRILVVDDDRDIRELVSESLRLVGHEVYEASHGHEALEWLSEHSNAPPCLLVLDLMMPVMSGWDFLQAFREKPAWQNLPVIVLSATLEMGRAEPVLRAQAFWSKPIDAEKLDRIHELCRAHRTSWPHQEFALTVE